MFAYRTRRKNSSSQASFVRRRRQTSSAIQTKSNHDSGGGLIDHKSAFDAGKNKSAPDKTATDKSKIENNKTKKPDDKKVKEIPKTEALPKHINTIEEKLNSLAGSGVPLPADILHFMETKFKANFSKVKIHTGHDAIELAEQLHAEAFTYGNDIYFNYGKYNPHTSSGKRLLAHELTHILHQTGKIQRKSGDGHDLTSADLQGDETLEAVFDGEQVLKKGDSGDAVKKVQDALIKLGFTLPVFGADGSYGNETANAVVKFQLSSGMTGADVDGITGKKTLGLLDMASRHGAAEKDADKKSEDFIIRGKPTDAAKQEMQVFFQLGKANLDKDEKSKLDKAAGKIVPPKLILKGFASEEGPDEVNKRLIQARMDAVRDYLDPKLKSSGVTMEDKPALEEGKNQVHYREFRSVKLINGDDKEEVKCGAGADKVKTCPDPYNIFNSAADKAIEMISVAKSKLPPKTADDEKLVFEKLFRPNNPGDKSEKDKIITDITDILDKMVKHIGNLKDNKNHVCATDCDGGCQSGSPAYNVDTPKPGDEGIIFICPSFEKEKPPQQAVIVIHEGHHGVPKIPSDDLAYEHTRLIRIIDKDTAMKNAASFHLLVELLNDPKSDFVGPKEDDELKGGITVSEAKDVNESLAWIEQWLSLVGFDTATHYSNIAKVRDKKSWVYDDDTSHAYFVMLDIFSPRFGLTLPPAFPSFDDQKSIAAVNDRIEQMETPFETKLTIEKVTSGVDKWEPGPKSNITVTQDFFKLPPSKMIVALLQELVHATPGISASLEPEYVIFINQMRTARNQGGPKT